MNKEILIATCEVVRSWKELEKQTFEQQTVPNKLQIVEHTNKLIVLMQEVLKAYEIAAKSS